MVFSISGNKDFSCWPFLNLWAELEQTAETKMLESFAKQAKGSMWCPRKWGLRDGGGSGTCSAWPGTDSVDSCFLKVQGRGMDIGAQPAQSLAAPCSRPRCPPAPKALQLGGYDKGGAELVALGPELLDALVHVPRISHERLPSSKKRPFRVSRYLCLLLCGLSGSVISIKFSLMAGNRYAF